MIWFEEKNVITCTHEVPYGMAVAIWMTEGCITQAIEDSEEFKKKTFY